MFISSENAQKVQGKEFYGNKFSNLPLDGITPSVVPNTITDISLMAMIFDGKVVAYRFRTDVGCFDITRAKAMEYGVSGFKVEKAIRLERYNGMLVTQSEIKNKRCIPDVSGCDEDCKKLFNALFSEADIDSWENYGRDGMSEKTSTNQNIGVEYAVAVASANIMNGAYWGFTDMQQIQKYIKDMESEPSIKVRKLGSTCLIEVQPGFLLNSIQKVDPNAVTQGDLNHIQRGMAEGLIGFEKFLIHYGKQIENGVPFQNKVGIYNISDTESTVVKGTNYPAFNVTMGDALLLLTKYGYEININGQFMTPMQAIDAGEALWESVTVSPIKQCIFIDIKSTLSASQIYAKEMEFKKKYDLA